MSKCPFDNETGCTALLCYDMYDCNVRKRNRESIIDQFATIEKTGELLPGFKWSSLQWDEKHGWQGWVVGPNGCNDLIKVRKIPDELLVGVHDCPKTIGYLDLKDKYPVDGDESCSA